MKQLLLILIAVLLTIPTFSTSCLAKDMNNEKDDEDRINKIISIDSDSTSMLTEPPANFRKVSEVSSLPDFMPGLGMLYVDPAMMPTGPYLGYDKDSKLINIVYMISLKQLDDHKNFFNLGAMLGEQTIDHIDISFNKGNAAMNEPHYQIVQWLIPNDDVEERTSR